MQMLFKPRGPDLVVEPGELDLAVGQADFCHPPFESVVSAHGEGSMDPTGKLNLDDLVVHHVVAGLKNSPSKLVGPQQFPELVLAFDDPHLPDAGRVGTLVKIDFHHIIRARVAVQATLEAKSGCARRTIFLPEIIQGSKRGDFLGLPSGQVDEKIEVMAGFCQEHGG